MSELSQNQREYVESRGKNQWESILQAQNQVMNWIFAVHGGGIAGLLAFASSKGPSCSVKLGLGAFSFGLVLLVFYGVFMYYFESNYYLKFRKDVGEIYNGAIDWKEFALRENGRPSKYHTCEVLAWLSGICGLIGIGAAVVAIL